MFCFGDTGPYEWPAVAFDELSQGMLDVLAGERIVVVATPNELATEQPEVVAMSAHGGLGQTRIQQVEQERREQLDDALTHGDVCRLDVP